MPKKKSAETAGDNGNASKEVKPKRTGPGAPWTFPQNRLEEAIEIAKAIEEKNAGNPMAADMVVKAVGFKRPDDWRFLNLLKSANQYGLVTGTGATATIALAKTGEDIVAPSDPRQRQAALLQAFRNVEDFKKVEAFYQNKKLPEDEFFQNTLVREFNIPRDRVGKFTEVFTANLEFLKAFRAEDKITETPAQAAESKGDGAIITKKIEIHAERVREFLDTCFVMMPFGPWSDVYYRDIYVPAIKDAGFEPVRGDELFSTGSVMEQIWEQIRKSKLLLSDLTGKNPNVFYELGLAHASAKPVIFTSGNLEDVPFDLRHLRVIIYEIKDPYWGDKLRKSLTLYLKNAKAEPEKSIPQPFRALPTQTETEQTET